MRIHRLFHTACVSCSVIGFTTAVHAADVCVGPAPSGDASGSDWNNQKAWGGTPSRGDTWYLADGTYSGKVFDAPESGSTLISIKKATTADHGPSAGFTSDLGDGQAAFTDAIQFESAHWVFDGQTGGGPGSWASGFGFKITSTDDAMAIIRIGYSADADDITVRHVDLEGKGSVSDQGGGYSNDAVAIYGAANVTLSYAWIHGAGRCPFFIDTADSVFEQVYVESYFGSASVHSEVASIWSFAGLPIGDITFRHNLITHIISTGGLMFDNSSNPDSHLYVYGNVFYKPPGDTWDQANGVIGGWTGGNNEEMHNVWVDNNSFIGIDQSSLSTLPNIASGSRAQNNLWYDSDPPSFSKFPTHDSNHFVSSGNVQGEANGTSSPGGDPFVSVAGLDFTLLANTEPGIDLGPPFDVDGLGHVRTTWTRGAYEFCETGCAAGGGGGIPPADSGLAGTTGQGASSGAGGSGGTSGDAGATKNASGSGDDGGCGCSTQSRGHRPWLLLLGLVLVAAGRRKRRG